MTCTGVDAMSGELALRVEPGLCPRFTYTVGLTRKDNQDRRG